MAHELSNDELGRRLSAGRGYQRMRLKDFAEQMKVDRHDLAKWEAGDFGSDARPRHQETKRLDAIRRVEKATGLPSAFFSIDFNDLPAMAAAWKRAGGVEPEDDAGYLFPEDDDEARAERP